MTVPPTTDCLCNHKIRCNTLLNALVPHSQYLSSVPIDARFDPLQSQSRVIYPSLSRQEQTEQRGAASPIVASPIPNSPSHHQQGWKLRQSPSPLLQPKMAQQHCMEPAIRSPRAGLVHAHIPPTTMTPPDEKQHLRPPPQSDESELSRPMPTMSRRPSVSRMARPTASKTALQQHPHDVAANGITKLDERLKTSHLEPPSGNSHTQARGRTTSTTGSRATSAQRAVSRNPSMPKMARPSASRSGPNPLDYQGVDEAPRQTHEPCATAREVYEYYQILNPRWLHLIESYPGTDMDRMWNQFDGDTKVARLAELVTSFQDLPATTALDAAQDSEYKSCKADLERLFRDVQLDSSAPNVASALFPSSVDNEVLMPNKHSEPLSESFVLPSSVKAAERRLAMSESGSTASLPRQNSRQPLRPRQSSLSWESDTTPEDALGFPSSVSTKASGAPNSRGKTYVPTYPRNDSDTENWALRTKPPATAPEPFQTPAPERLREDLGGTNYSRHVPYDDAGYPYASESLNTPAVRKAEPLLHHAPITSSPTSRRLLRTMNSVDAMTRNGLPYKYTSTRDVLRSQRGDAAPDPERDQNGDIARYYGDYMKVGDNFVPYSPGGEDA